MGKGNVEEEEEIAEKEEDTEKTPEEERDQVLKSEWGRMI